MTKVIAALDDSLAAKPVLATALALGRLLGAEVEPVHVGGDSSPVAQRAAEDAELPLRFLAGPVVARLLEEGRAEEVVAVVVGARGTPGGRRPLGSTSLAVATLLAKPVVVVPPDANPPATMTRVLVPVEGVSPSLTPREIVALAEGTQLDVLVLHVHEEQALPAFTDQPQHEHQAWAQEFLRRYCPWGIGTVRLEVRVGRSDELVPLVAEQERVDLIALGWAQELAEGRAPVVRATLARCLAPVMLVPVRVAAANGPAADAKQSAMNVQTSRT